MSLLTTLLQGLQGTNVNAIENLAVTDGNIIVGNGSTWVAENGATARTSLGVGTGDSPQFTGLTFDGSNTMQNFVDSSTWTPTITTSGTSPDTLTYTTQVGYYTRIGNLVAYTARIQINAFTLGGGSGDISIAGLPLTSKNVASLNWLATVWTGGVNLNNSTVSVVGQLASNSTSVGIYQVIDDAALDGVLLSGLAAGDIISISGMYLV